MKIFFYNLMLITLLTSCQKDSQDERLIKNEISIYDKDGNAIAYCNFSNDNECIIYLWNGKPTSYYLTDNEKYLYGYNGKFLGWRESGIYYDLDGKRIGFEEKALNIVTALEPIKSIKELLPIKSIKEIKPIRPINSLDWSSKKLDAFLLKGRE